MGGGEGESAGDEKPPGAGESSSPAIVAITADWHVNDALGLCPRSGMALDDGGVYRPNKLQRAIWRAWERFWEEVSSLRAGTGGRIYAVANGDLGDLNRHNGVQLISRHKASIKEAMIAAARPMAEVADRIFIVRGTEAHSGGGGELEEFLARDLGAEPAVPPRDGQGGRFSWWVLEAEFGGVEFDISHHPPTSSRRPWTINQGLARAAAIVASRYRNQGREPPDIAVFAHSHQHGVGSEMGVWAFGCPPWKGVGAFGHRLGAGAVVQPVGGWVFVCEGGEWRCEGGGGPLSPILFHAPRRRRWREE